MRDDDTIHDDENEEEPENRGSDEVPASVAFMEIMRQAAASRGSSSESDEQEQPAPPDAVRAESGDPEHDPPAPLQPEVDEEAQKRRAAALEEQRVRRIKKRRARRRQRTLGVAGSVLRTFIVVAVAAGLSATILTWGRQLLPERVSEGLSVAQATATRQQAALAEPTGLPTPNWLRRIGVVSGHRGPEGDPGAVCPDGLTETEITFNISQLVVRNLRGRGFSVDLLDEFDPRLDNYQAAALISLHANTCQDFGEFVSGFIIAQAAARPADGPDNILVECVAEHYGQATGLDRRDTPTRDMTEYHTFGEIHPDTPAAILEMGFMLADRALLTGQPDLLARSITDGVLCFLEPGDNAVSAATPEANS